MKTTMATNYSFHSSRPEWPPFSRPLLGDQPSNSPEPTAVVVNCDEEKWSRFDAYVLHHTWSNSKTPIEASLKRFLEYCDLPFTKDNMLCARARAVPATTQEPNGYGLRKRLFLNWRRIVPAFPLAVLVVIFQCFSFTYSEILTIVLLICLCILAYYNPCILSKTDVYVPKHSVTVVETYSDWCIGCPCSASYKGKVFNNKRQRRKCVPRQIVAGIIMAPRSLFVPRACWHNMEHSLIRRQLLPIPPDTPATLKFWNRAKQLSNTHIVKGWQQFEKLFPVWLDARPYPGNRKKQLTVAYSNFCESQHKGNATKYFIKAFIKREKLLSARHKRIPRFISPAGDDYLVTVATHYEAWFDAWKHQNYFETGYICSSGMTNVQIGMIVTNFEVNGYFAISADVRKMDAHISATILAVELSHYAKSGFHKFELDQLNQQKTTVGMAGHIKFEVEATRCSGVSNTTGGNCVVMRAWWYALLYQLGGRLVPYRDFCIMNVGDDSLLFLSPSLGHIFEKLRGLDTSYTGLFVDFQHYYPDQYNLLEYCSQYFWNYGTISKPRRVLGPKIFRTLAKTFTPIQDIKRCHYRSWLKEVATSFIHYRDLPVLGDFICSIASRDISHDEKLLPGSVKSQIRREFEYKPSLQYVEPEDSVVLAEQFAQIYGIAPQTFDFLKSIDFFVCSGVVVQCAEIETALAVDGVMECTNDCASTYFTAAGEAVSF